MDAPQNRINRLADTISFKARQNQLNAIKNKIFDMNTMIKGGGDNNKKELYPPSGLTNAKLNGEIPANKTYNSER